jgi:hypothetical protein
MTPSQVAFRALPTVQRALKNAEPEIRETVGRVKWAAVSPLWWILTGSALSILIRVAIELAIGWMAPWILPFLTAMEPMAHRFLADPGDKEAFADVMSLLRTPVSTLSEPARQALREARDA